MNYRFEYRIYRRPFRQPLHTHHGLWCDRTGIILQITQSSSQTGYGEIAPLEWFGSETLGQAVEFCTQLQGKIDEDTIFAIPDTLPACQFGFESAWEMLTQPDKPSPPYRYSALLPAGERALEVWRSLYSQGFYTFKWKIGVTDLSQELEWFYQLTEQLPQEIHLRLDANGGLTYNAAQLWLQACQTVPQMEFLEQPLPPDQFEAMQELSDRFSTPIALDESVAHARDLEICYDKGWRGIFVVKPAIAGSPRRLRSLMQKTGMDGVWSSVFETAIARKYIETRLVASLAQHRALGFGTPLWFADAALDQPDFSRLWHTLTPT